MILTDLNPLATIGRPRPGRLASGGRWRLQSLRCGNSRTRRLTWPGLASTLLALAWLCAGLRCPAEPPSLIDPQQEYNVKGAFLYSFGRYVGWPAQAEQHASGSFVIGVIGTAPLDRILDRISRTKQVEGRPITVHRFQSLTDYRPCHILFVTRSIPAEQQQLLLEHLKTEPVLLVGEIEGFAKQGGIIEFYIDQGKVRFDINVEAARQKQLQLDAKLLSIAGPRR